MAHDDYIYGIIKLWYQDDPETKKLDWDGATHNFKTVLDSYPFDPTSFPNIFSPPAKRQGGMRHPVVSFAAQINWVCEPWGKWLHPFTKFLSCLNAKEAKVTLEADWYGTHAWTLEPRDKLTKLGGILKPSLVGLQWVVVDGPVGNDNYWYQEEYPVIREIPPELVEKRLREKNG